VTAGYEFVAVMNLVENAQRVREEVVEHLKSPPVTAGKKDLVLLPSHLWLTIHESLGHSTELDRALGYEANYAGTSFLTTDKLGKERVGSDLINVWGDRTSEKGLATVGYDDDGVKATRFPIFEKGIFKHYQTIRDQAALIGEKESRGCCFADSWSSVPFQRMPNVSLEAGKAGTSLDDLIGGVEDGILIDGDGSFSIDQQRYNFQFGGDAFWEIKKGKKAGMVSRVAYQARTRFLAGLRRHRRTGLLPAIRRTQRRQGRTHPDQRRKSRLQPGTFPPDQRHPDRLRPPCLPKINSGAREKGHRSPTSRVQRQPLQHGDAFIRFALNGVPPAASWRNSRCRFPSPGSQDGSTSVDEFDEAAIRNAVQAAEQLSELTPANPEASRHWARKSTAPPITGSIPRRPRAIPCWCRT
jgi:predicted Zn-dependent protease